MYNIKMISREILINRIFRIVLMGFLFYIVLSITYNIYSIDNVRYLVSSLIQSQAAILAIVVSLTLVGVQLSAQKYTPRLIDIFIRDKFFWKLITFYITTIILGSFLLYALPRNPCYIIVSFSLFGSGIMFCYSYVFLMLSLYIIMTIEALYFLKSYIIYILNILKPENMIRRVINTIKITDIEDYSLGKRAYNPLATVYELCKNIIEAYDEESSIVCAKLLVDLFKRTNNSFINNYPELKRSCVIPDRQTMKKVRVFDNIVRLFVDILFKLTIHSIDHELYNASVEFTSALGEIGKTIVGVGGLARVEALEIADALRLIDERVVKEITKLKDVYKSTLPYVLFDLLRMPIFCLGDIAIQDIKSVRNINVSIMYDILHFLHEIAASIHKSGQIFENPFTFERSSVRLFTILMVLCDMADEILNQIDYLRTKTKTEIKNDLEHNYLRGLEIIVEHIKLIADISIQYKLEKEIDHVCFYLWRLSCSLYDRGLNKQALLILKVLYRVLVRGYNQGTAYLSFKHIIRGMNNKINEHVTAGKSSLNAGFVKSVTSFLTSLYIFVSKEEDHPLDFILGAPESLGKLASKLIESCNDNLVLFVVDKLSKYCEEIRSKKGEQWQRLFEEGIRWLIYLGVSWLQKGNELGASKIARKILDLVEGNKQYISGIMSTIEKSRSYGISVETEFSEHIIIPIEEMYEEIKLDEYQYKYFLEFKNMILNS